jgi:hypothetical protein
MAKNVKIKILKPVVHAGAVHRPNKIGRITEVPADQAKVLIRGGFAEEAAEDARITPGVTVRPDLPPPVIELRDGSKAALQDPEPESSTPQQQQQQPPQS